jgi:hypothetical protein
MLRKVKEEKEKKNYLHTLHVSESYFFILTGLHCS